MRCSSMNPVTLPTLRDLSLLDRDKGLGRLPGVELSQCPLVFVREHLDKPAAHRVPMVEDCQRPRASGEAQVAFDRPAQQREIERHLRFTGSTRALAIL